MVVSFVCSVWMGDLEQWCTSHMPAERSPRSGNVFAVTVFYNNTVYLTHQAYQKWLAIHVSFYVSISLFLVVFIVRTLR
jgi:hypothetical protein